MSTSKKRILSYGIVTAVLVISTAYLLLPPQLKLSYVLDDAHLAEVEPQGTWRNMTCPQCESQLEEIVMLRSDTPIQKLDSPWRYACYCRYEDIFWVFDFPGGVSFPRWYGPFNAYWKLTNIVASSLVTISCVALVLLVTKEKRLD